MTHRRLSSLLLNDRKEVRENWYGIVAEMY
jgi:hypothetical protein